MEYLLRWEIELWATSPEKAAKEARRIQRGQHQEVCVFDVIGEDGTHKRIDAIDGAEVSVKMPATDPVRVVVRIEEGLVQDIISDKPAEILLVDFDIQDEDETTEIVDKDGEIIGRAALTEWNEHPNPERVELYWKQQ